MDGISGRTRRRTLAMLGAAPAWPALLRAATRAPRVGLLFFGAMPAAGHSAEPIVRALDKLGWREPSNVEYVARYAQGRRDAYESLATDIAARSPDVLFCAGSDIARAVRSVPSTTPVVFAVSDDPVASGLVASLARPGGRFTGVSFMSPELAAKRLELLKEIVPSLRRVAMLTDAAHDAMYMPRFAEAARAAAVEPVPVRFEQPQDFASAFAAAGAARVDGMFVVPSRFTLVYARQIAELSIARRLPAISAYDSFARAGGLASYGPTSAESIARAASFVDRILRGARAADLPVEQATGVALVVNATTASAMGVALSSAILARADEVIR